MNEENGFSIDELLGGGGNSLEATLMAKVNQDLGLTDILEEEKEKDMIDNIDKERLLGEHYQQGEELQGAKQENSSMQEQIQMMLQQMMASPQPEMGQGEMPPEMGQGMPPEMMASPQPEMGQGMQGGLMSDIMQGAM